MTDSEFLDRVGWLLAATFLQKPLLLADPRLADHPIVYHNRAFEELTGYPAGEIDGRNCRFLQGADTDAADVARLGEAIAQGRPAQVTLRNYRRDGTPFWNDLTLTPLLGGDGTPTFWAGVQEDVTDARDAEWSLRENEKRLRFALESADLGSWDLDLKTGRYLSVSETWKAQFCLPPDDDLTDFRQEKFLTLLHPDDRERVRGLADRAVADGTDYATEYRCVWPDGSVHWISAHGRILSDALGAPVRMIGMTQEITARKDAEAERERALAEARERADRDSLTGLLNHAAFHRRLEAEVARCQREGTTLALVMLDMDNFKFFNDAYGHATGDGVIRQVADALQGLCRPYDTVARFGGDEFALLLPGVGEATLAEAEVRLRADLAGLSHRPEGVASAIPITVTLGAALFPRDSCERAALMGVADGRLLRAKTGGDQDSEADRVRRALSRDVAGFSMLDALVTAVDNKDRYTRRHSEDVMAYGLMIATEIGLGEEDRRVVAMAALVHDVGKIGVPDHILRKPGKLTDEEFAAVRQHPEMGAVMVSAVSGLEDTLGVVRHHHERWDGGGYPAGLSGPATPPMARLMAVADAFSAMTTDRPYRRGMDSAQALSVLEAGATTQWDPDFVAAFARAIGRRAVDRADGDLGMRIAERDAAAERPSD